MPIHDIIDGSIRIHTSSSRFSSQRCSRVGAQPTVVSTEGVHTTTDLDIHRWASQLRLTDQRQIEYNSFNAGEQFVQAYCSIRPRTSARPSSFDSNQIHTRINQEETITPKEDYCGCIRSTPHGLRLPAQKG